MRVCHTHTAHSLVVLRCNQPVPDTLFVHGPTASCQGVTHLSNFGSHTPWESHPPTNEVAVHTYTPTL